jgi:hypothetical protein
MSVNLDLLRRALGTRHGDEDEDIIDAAAEAILDATRVWWCAVRLQNFTERAELCGHSEGHDGSDCRWVVLVFYRR